MRKADNLPPSCAVVTKSGNLNFLEPSGLVQACNGTALPFTPYTHWSDILTCETGTGRQVAQLPVSWIIIIVIIIIIIIVIIIIEFLTSQLWLGNIHLSWDVVINRIRLGGLNCSLQSSLQLSMCQELQIFAVIYMYWGAS